MIYLIAHPFEVMFDLFVFEPNDFEFHFSQKFASFFIFIKLRNRCVIIAVKLDNELCFSTIEIGDIFPKYLLTRKTNGIIG